MKELHQLFLPKTLSPASPGWLVIRFMTCYKLLSISFCLSSRAWTSHSYSPWYGLSPQLSLFAVSSIHTQPCVLGPRKSTKTWSGTASCEDPYPQWSQLRSYTCTHLILHDKLIWSINVLTKIQQILGETRKTTYKKGQPLHQQGYRPYSFGLIWTFLFGWAAPKPLCLFNILWYISVHINNLI